MVSGQTLSITRTSNHRGMLLKNASPFDFKDSIGPIGKKP